MQTLKYIFLLVPLMGAALQAQTSAVTTATFSVEGNCGMCKKSIEKAAAIKGVKTASWNEKTRILEIKFDSRKSSPQSVLRNVAYAGYDNEKYLAPRTAYEKLHGCCQYERKNNSGADSTAPATDAQEGHHATAAPRQADTKHQQKDESGINNVYDSYFILKEALVKSDAQEAAGAADRFLGVVEKVNMSAMHKSAHDVYMKELGAIRSAAGSIAREKNIEKQRAAFSKMTDPLYRVMKSMKPPYEVYLDHCPMYGKNKGADWISKEAAIRNPFFGSKMMSCGNIKETIK